MGDGHGRSWNFRWSHAELAREGKEGEGEEEVGGTVLGAPWGEGRGALGRGC
jgi:hypothetical protein